MCETLILYSYNSLLVKVFVISHFNDTFLINIIINYDLNLIFYTN